MEKHRKQIAFDLDTKMLEKYYPTENWRNAYEDIKKHMKANGFKWQQGSVYVSDGKMLSSDVTIILKALIRKHPWINKCMRDCRETDIGRNHNKNNLFNKDADIPTRTQRQNAKTTQTRKKVNIKDMIKQNVKRSASQHSSPTNNKNKNHGIGDD